MKIPQVAGVSWGILRAALVHFGALLAVSKLLCFEQSTSKGAFGKKYAIIIA